MCLYTLDLDPKLRNSATVIKLFEELKPSALQGPEAAAAARQKEVFQALARFCSQVSGEAISEEQVKHFRFRDWRRFTQVSRSPVPSPCCYTDPLSSLMLAI